MIYLKTIHGATSEIKFLDLLQMPHSSWQILLLHISRPELRVALSGLCESDNAKFCNLIWDLESVDLWRREATFVGSSDSLSAQDSVLSALIRLVSQLIIPNPWVSFHSQPPAQSQILTLSQDLPAADVCQSPSELAKIWATAIRDLETRIVGAQVRAWIGPLRPLRLVPGSNGLVLELQAPNDFSAKWVNDHYLEEIESCLSRQVNKAVRISVNARRGDRSVIPDATAPKSAGDRTKALVRKDVLYTPAVAEIHTHDCPKNSRDKWKLPPIDFLRTPPKVEGQVDKEKLLENSQILKQKFADFGIDGEVTAVRPGPVITLYEFKPAPGIRVSKIAALADDLSMALSAQSVRIIAPLPNKAVVGIEIPSEMRETVFLRDFLQHTDFHGTKHVIPIVMGKDIGGQPYLSDLARMPHLLCAGQTGSGKSVFMNGLICSLLYRFTPSEMRLILVDPKFIEFRGYQDLPHLLLPVVDDPCHANTALKWAVREMDRRYRILAMMGARNLATFNQKVDEMGIAAVRDFLCSEENQPKGLEKMSGGDWINSFETDSNGSSEIGKLPFIVIIIDELADLMMIAKKDVEISIARIAQKARAAGIHLVIATQRPSGDVITGLIKANVPTKVSFQLASYIDSRTILDRPGAERLLGQGDMLFIPPGVSQVLRLHGAYVDDDEIGKITTFLKEQGKPAYRDEILVDDEDELEDDEENASDELFLTAVELVQKNGHASASFLQRHLKIGYNHAAKIIEDMEARGIVGPPDGARPREVLVTS